MNTKGSDGFRKRAVKSFRFGEIWKDIAPNTASNIEQIYPGADKSLARPTSGCILFNGENISFDASLVICINSTNIPPIMIINRIY